VAFTVTLANRDLSWTASIRDAAIQGLASSGFGTSVPAEAEAGIPLGSIV
jgi:hypothetical protein